MRMISNQVWKRSNQVEEWVWDWAQSKVGGSSFIFILPILHAGPHLSPPSYYGWLESEACAWEEAQEAHLGACQASRSDFTSPTWNAHITHIPNSNNRCYSHITFTVQKSWTAHREFAKYRMCVWIECAHSGWMSLKHWIAYSLLAKMTSMYNPSQPYRWVVEH